MKFTERKLTEIQKEIQDVLKLVSAKKLDEKTAADKIVHLREEMDAILDHLRKKVL